MNSERMTEIRELANSGKRSPWRIALIEMLAHAERVERRAQSAERSEEMMEREYAALERRCRLLERTMQDGVDEEEAPLTYPPQWAATDATVMQGIVESLGRHLTPEHRMSYLPAADASGVGYVAALGGRPYRVMYLLALGDRITPEVLAAAPISEMEERANE